MMLEMDRESLGKALKNEAYFDKSLDPIGNFGLKLEQLKKLVGIESPLYLEFTSGALAAVSAILDTGYQPDEPLTNVLNYIK